MAKNKRSPSTKKAAGSRGNRGSKPRGRTSGRAAKPPRSEIAEDLLAFAENLRSSATEAATFVESEVEKRLGWGATKNAETRFFNRAANARTELLQRRRDFEELNARCPSADPCRQLIDELAASGIGGLIETVAEDLSDIAVRADRPLSDEDRDQLRSELQSVVGMLEGLVKVAEWIEDEAIVLKGGTVPGRRRSPEQPADPPLPREIQVAVLEAESAAEEFLNKLAAAPPEFDQSGRDTTLLWLKHLDREREHLAMASNKVVKIAGMLDDTHRAAAERQGHSGFLRFLNTEARIVRRVAVRRALSNDVIKNMMDRLISRLSLTDNGSHVASRLVVMAEDLKRRLQSDGRLLFLQAERATNEERANAVTAEQLPDWTDVIGPGGEDNPSTQAQLLMAFVDYDGDEPEFCPATVYELVPRLNRMFGGKNQKGWESWIGRHLPKLLKSEIVFKHDRTEGLSRQVADQYEVCRAAIRKYRRYLVRSQSPYRPS